jgi:carboxypeptidase C (cathepsin A)
VRAFARTEYASALLAGSDLNPDDRARVLSKLARYTGLSEDYWDRANLRVDEGRFTQELLRSHGATVGRIDSRFKGASINLLGESAFYDPSTTAIGPAFVATFMDYYRSELEVEDSANYVVSANVFMDWDWRHKQPDVNGFTLPFPNTSVDLAYAMKQNPSMKVLIQQGYFDLATPYFATEYVVEHMNLTPELRNNIELKYYEAGHMMYVNEPSLVEFKKDLGEFVRTSH